MLFEYTTIVKLERAEDTLSIHPQPLCAILINPLDMITQWHLLLDIFLYKESSPYTLCVDCRKDSLQHMETLFNKLILLSFGKNYLKNFEIPSLNFILPNKITVREQTIFDTKIQHYFIAQGYAAINTSYIYERQLNVFDPEITRVYLSDPVFDQQQEIQDWLSGFYINRKIMEVKIKFFVNTTEELFSSIKIIDAINKKMKVIYPEQHNLLKEIKKIRQEKEMVLALFSKQKEKLEYSETHNQLLRREIREGMEKIKKWYHKEYEVLPLWYKRFGHLIKFMMGKRSFKSLFKD